MFGAADAIRQHTGQLRFKVHQASYHAAVMAVQNTLVEKEFEDARDVARLVGQALGSEDIATRLFISPRTVQTHLTHIYNKLGLSSRVPLAQEVARHT